MLTEAQSETVAMIKNGGHTLDTLAEGLEISRHSVENRLSGLRRAGVDVKKKWESGEWYYSVGETQIAEDGVVKRGICWFDLHWPEHDLACLKIGLDFAEDFQPHYFVKGGDMLDMGSISFHNRNNRKMIGGDFGLQLKKDYKDYQLNVLDELNKRLPRYCEKTFIIGNHEYFVDRLLENQPNFKGMIELENNLELDDWEIVPFNHHKRIGMMTFIHGDKYNKYHAEANSRIYNTQIFSGHCHQNQVYTNHSPIDQLPWQGVSVGCMAKLNPMYMRDKPSAWVNQFMYWYQFEDGSFTYYTPIIINGRCVINGKVYNGNSASTGAE